jgi:hypothetical protein
MSALGSALAERSICFSLPYIESTKGEMLAKVRGLGLEKWLQRSRSCIHTSLRIRHVTHCGVCPACIERRQAFAVAHIEEDTAVYALDIFKDTVRGIERAYFDLFTEEGSALLEEDPRTLRRLRTYTTVTGIDDDYSRVHRLLLRHAEEIQQVFRRPRGRYPSISGKEFIAEAADEVFR